MASARAAERLEQLRADLKVDRALSEGQVLRHYGLNLDQLKDVTLTEAYLSPTRGSYRYCRVVFVVLSPALARSDAAGLRHLAGVAEMRRILNARPNSWQSMAEARHRPYVPDACWHTPQGTLAIEYDAGSYSRAQVLAKARAFRHYIGQIWGTPNPARARHLAHVLQAVDPRARSLAAAWS